MTTDLALVFSNRKCDIEHNIFIHVMVHGEANSRNLIFLAHDTCGPIEHGHKVAFYPYSG